MKPQQLLTRQLTGDQPVTQDEFDRVMTAVKQDLDDIRQTMATKDDLAGVKGELTSLRKVQEATLTVVQSIEGRLKDIANHEERIERLEDHVLPLKSRR